MIRNFLVLLCFIILSSTAFGVGLELLNMYRSVKIAIKKIEVVGTVISGSTCVAPIPNSRMDVLFFYQSNHPKLKAKNKVAITRFSLDKGKFRGIRELPVGTYKIKIIDNNSNKVLEEIEKQVTRSDLHLKLVAQCKK